MSSEDVAPEKLKRSRFKIWILLLGVLLLAGGGVVRSVVMSRSDVCNDDPTPAPRTPSNAPYIVSTDVAINKMVEISKIGKDDLVYDLGCGDARIVAACAKAFGCRGVGIELDEKIAEKARANIEGQGLEGLIEIRQEDVFKADFSDADCIVMYILPWMVEKLYPEFQKLKPGTRIISHNYGFGGNLASLPPDETYEVMTNHDGLHRIYVWVTPLKPMIDVTKKSSPNKN
ncbi:MAG: cyclopropane-fatty-acyl-phospholipid synthase family protein [Planctomycetaceae bacterium]